MPKRVELPQKPTISPALLKELTLYRDNFINQKERLERLQVELEDLVTEYQDAIYAIEDAIEKLEEYTPNETNSNSNN